MSIGDFIPKKYGVNPLMHKDLDAEMQEQPPAQPMLDGLSRRRRSQAAADAAQQWEELEQENAKLAAGRNSDQARIEVLEGEIAMLGRTIEQKDFEIARLQTQNDSLNREIAAIRTRVDVSAEVLLGIRQIQRTEPEKVSIDDFGLKAVAEALEEGAD